ncbi:HEAT repeat domain-containing protein [Tautonia rosea]|uniref:HEAT repeat domain-containing protein n=1 Tax=Tautonia rosea TaxID=2728037 RepID=UPI00147533C2|nr:hypothetical protein [Tautonia rosea]
MIDAMAPAWARNLSRGLALLLVVGGLGLLPPMSAKAQQEDDQTTNEADQDAPADGELTPEKQDQQEVLADSIYVDPVAASIMRGRYDQLHTSVLVPPNTDRTIAQMARGAGRLDAGLIDRFIKYSARQLTDHDNINAVMSNGQSSRIQSIEEAGKYLMLPYTEVPKSQQDRRFLQEFNARLLGVAPDLLKNHLYSRVQVMQALSRMGDPVALNLFLTQLRDPDQPLIVKQLAAEGVRRIAVEAGDSISTADRENAANALVEFLRGHPDAYWLSQARALQAIGTLRQISGIQNRDQAVFANEVLAILSMPEQRPESRSWAAWALGMLEVPPNYPQLNFTLAAYQIGSLAVEIGQRIVDLSDPRELETYNPERVKYLTALIVAPLFSSLDGASEFRGSGLRNTRGLGPHQQYVVRVHQLVRQLAVASVELTNARGAQIPAARDRVIGRLNELRTFLTENRPEDGTFVSGGREFALQDAS